METVTDSKAFTLFLWNRWFKAFNRHIHRCGLNGDLNQTLEMVSLMCRGMERKQFSKIGQHEFYDFMKSIGFRKRAGYWVLRECQFNQDAWEKFYKTGLFNLKGDL